jgi:signal transduction histidine kinase
MVTLFALAFVSTLLIAGAGFVSLLWHRQAVTDLDFVLHQSPQLDQLSRAISRIPESLCGPLDIRQGLAALEIRKACLKSVSQAEDELFAFRGRAEKLPLGNERDLHARRQMSSRLDRVFTELQTLKGLASQIEAADSPESHGRFLDLQYRTSLVAARVQNSLLRLPPYHTHDWIRASLDREKQRSDSLLYYIILAAGGGLLCVASALLAAHQWISRPIKEISQGCSRIANGDTAWRLSTKTRWQDEFFDLVSGVNCMADRFQQSEEDLQEKVRERSEQLMRSQRLANVGFLAAGVAHEINNPLTAISLAADSLEFRLSDHIDLDSDDGRDLLERVAMIRRESRRCGDITARLLDFSRGDRGQQVQTNLTELVHEVLSMVRHLGRFSDRSLEFECTEPVTAEVIPSQIKQVILNLVSNALQATAPGGRVVIRLVEQIDNVVLSVVDNGCGMDQETLQHVFDPFFTSQPQGQGTGLGLSITHRIVEDHGGTVTPGSAGAGQGSTFQVRLPRRQRSVRAA